MHEEGFKLYIKLFNKTATKALNSVIKNRFFNPSTLKNQFDNLINICITVTK